MNKVTVHCLVKNEERWIWYAIMSVIDWVDEVMVWDTGSTDKTARIVESIAYPKIKFRQVIANSREELTNLRRQMLAETTTDWVLIVDGDEIWTIEAMREIREFIKNPKKSLAGVSRFWSLLGDVFHYLPDRFGRYHVGSELGHLTIRLLRRLPELQVRGDYPWEGFVYGKTLTQDLPVSKLHYLRHKFFHASFLPRSTHPPRLFQRKVRYQLGSSLSDNFPAVFYLPRPRIVPSPWGKAGMFFYLMAGWQTSLRVLKNILLDTIRSTRRPAN